MTRKKKQVIDEIIETLDKAVNNVIEDKADAIVIPVGVEYNIDKLTSHLSRPKVGDSLVHNGIRVKVVEVLEGHALHVKNQDAPFNSFLIEG